MDKSFQKYGIKMPTVLLPQKEIAMQKWSVIACDQYTSQPEYWDSVKSYVADSPSTLKMILPEVYLAEENIDRKISKINKCMKNYVDTGVLQEIQPGFILIKRNTRNNKIHKGVLTAIDLEEYDYSSNSHSLIRATESTVMDRLPPRIRIRENAPLELPHIMVLIDDPEKTVIEPLFENIPKAEKIYDFDLMLDSGHITGYLANDHSLLSMFLKGLEKLADVNRFSKAYKTKSCQVMMYAVGDGNHSLAAAKNHWNNTKRYLNKEDFENHPARYALVELVNIHDDGIEFEPIHRIVFNADVCDFINTFKHYFAENEPYAYEFMNTDEMYSVLAKIKDSNAHIFPFTTLNKTGFIVVKQPTSNLPTATLQAFLDDFIASHPGSQLDYIHGEDTVKKLSTKQDAIGLYLPSINKHELFKSIILDGTLPRKTFSMGDADDKKFYLECRKIK